MGLRDIVPVRGVQIRSSGVLLRETLTRRGACVLCVSMLCVPMLTGCARTPEEEAWKAQARLEVLMTTACGGALEYDETDPARPVIGLDFHGGEVLDAGFSLVGKIPTIRTLKLANLRRLTDRGLAYLTGLAALETLDLRGSNLVSDNGLRHLSGLVRLKELDLSDNARITDAGLRHLHTLNELQSLGLANTSVTEDGVKELKLALPKVQITH